ncbi:MAG: hypothetical protein ACAI25_12385 [Planctomycetota bacterium]
MQPGPAGVQCIETPRTQKGQVALGGKQLAREAVLHAHVYRFGTGIVRLQFDRDELALEDIADLSVHAEELTLEGRPIIEHARELAQAIRKRLRPYAFATYETLLEAVEVYPLVRAGELPEGVASGEEFCRAHERLLVAIMGGDPRRGDPSAFAREEYPVKNVGPLRDDVVVVNDAGGLIHASAHPRGPRSDQAALAEARTIEGLVELAYAQYWSLRSVDHVIQHLQDQAYTFTSGFLKKSPDVTMGAVTHALYRAREEHMAVSNIVDDFLEIPAIGSDGYLDAFFRHARDMFGVRERSHTAQERLEDLEKSYETVHSMINERRLMTLEVLVLIVIVIELVIGVVELFHRG